METIRVETEIDEKRELRQSLQQLTAESIQKRIEQRISEGKTSLRIVKLTNACTTIDEAEELMLKSLDHADSPYEHVRSLLEPSSLIQIETDCRGLKLHWNQQSSSTRFSMRHWSCGIATIVTLLALVILSTSLAVIVHQ